MRVALILAVVVCAVAAQKNWTITHYNFATIGIAVAFPQKDQGIVPVAMSDGSAFVWETTNGGKTFAAVPNAVDAGFFTAAAAGGTTGVVGDALSLECSDLANGSYSFSRATIKSGKRDVLLWESQNVEVFPDQNTYGCAGQDGAGVNGVAVSGPNCYTWNAINISELVTESRYGAYPSATTWYISAGQWPGNDSLAAAHPNIVKMLTKNIALVRAEDGSVHHEVLWDENAPRGKPGQNDNGWIAQIAKTTDAGQTWTSVFEDWGNFYFNQITCPSEDHCCAVGEGDQTSSAPGIRIWCTVDGGNTWQNSFFDANPNFSIMAIQYISENEFWAAGGDFQGFKGYLWHTVDGGVAWEYENLNDVYVQDLCFPSESIGYATAFNIESQSSFLTYS
jgi:hypothetical protein